jgi:hypothetical protein
MYIVQFKVWTILNFFTLDPDQEKRNCRSELQTFFSLFICSYYDLNLNKRDFPIVQSINYYANPSLTCLKVPKCEIFELFFNINKSYGIWVPVRVSGTGKKLFILKTDVRLNFVAHSQHAHKQHFLKKIS